MLRLIALVLPMAVDSFAMAGLIWAVGVPAGRGWRMAALFTVFEGAMPLAGLALGYPLARVIGGNAGYVASAAMVGLGIRRSRPPSTTRSG